MKAIILILMMFPLTLMAQSYVGKRVSKVLVENPDPRFDVNEGELTLISDTLYYIFNPVASYDSIYHKSWIKVNPDDMIITKQVFSINRLCLREIMLQIHSLELQGLKYTKIDDGNYTIITAWMERRK